jgi:DNA-directed RNA polymerase subunit RPC12/RpoP
MIRRCGDCKNNKGFPLRRVITIQAATHSLPGFKNRNDTRATTKKQTTMKSKSTIIRILIAAAALGAFTATAHAGPGLQYWKSLGTEAQFKALKPGEPVVYVCNKCKSLSEVEIKSQEHAMELCKVGSNVVCPSCRMTVKIVSKTRRNDPATHAEVVYVNEDGEECGFFAKSAGKK